jgi:hypothetical protein
VLGESLAEIASEVEYVHDAMALARYIVVLFRVLHREGDKKFAIDEYDVERGIRTRQLWINKRGRRVQGLPLVIIHFHVAAPEIGDIQAGLARCIRGDGESFIDGSALSAGVGVGEVVAGVVTRDDPVVARIRGVKAFRVDAGVPADNRPILGCKMKRAGADAG